MTIRILVVDDATFIRDMVKKNLREKVPGAEVFDAADGNRAIALMKTQHVDVILSDWEMPGMTGEEFLRWVRSHEHYQATPFIMVTSRGDRNHVIKAVEAGVSDYITKPFTPDELLKKTFKQLKKIGKLPTAGLGQRKGATQGVTHASVDALTGGAGSAPRAKPVSPAANQRISSSAVAAETLGALTGQAVAPAKTPAKAGARAKAKPAAKTKGRAQLRFAGGTGACVIRELSLQALNGLLQRGENLPTVFDQAVVDIETDGGDSVARVNGYVHSVQAAENKVDSNIVKIVIRFVDNDPDKFEVLSKYIAQIQ